MLVCDASLAVELSLDRIGARAALALGEHDLVAPPLLWSEVPSVLHELAFRGEISEALATQGLARFERELDISERRADGQIAAAWRLASGLGWAKTYDAEYVALAQLLDCRVVTLDLRLRRGVDHLGSVVTLAELSERQTS